MKILLLISFCWLCLTTSLSAQSFELKGTTKGIADGTWIYLKLTDENKYLDSAQVIGNHFLLQGKLAEEVGRVFLHTKQFKNYTTLWLENKPLEIFVSAGQFKESILIGSATETENSSYRAQGLYYMKLQDSITSFISQTADTARKAILKKELTKIRQLDKDLDINYISQHPDSWIAVNILNVYKSSWDKDLVAALYQHLSDKIKQSSYGLEINRFLSLYKEHNIGDRFTDFAQYNPQGKLIRLSEIKGKYTLIEFWGSWCQPCRDENPALIALYKKYQRKGFSILGVSIETDRKHWEEAIQEDKIPWENISELNGDKNTACLIYGISSYPSNFLIDQNGIIIAKNIRKEALRKKLEELFGK